MCRLVWLHKSTQNCQKASEAWKRLDHKHQCYKGTNHYVVQGKKLTYQEVSSALTRMLELIGNSSWCCTRCVHPSTLSFTPPYTFTSLSSFFIPLLPPAWSLSRAPWIRLRTMPNDYSYCTDYWYPPSGGFWQEKSQQIFLTPLADQETHERENVTKLTSDDV